MDASRGPKYALQLDPEGLARVRLETPPGRALAELLLLSSVHVVGATDELDKVEPVEVRAIDENVVEISQVARSSIWEWKRAVMRSYPDHLEYWCEVQGKGALDEVHFFEAGERANGYSNWYSPSGFWRPARARTGWRGSLSYFSTVFNPAPNGAFRQYSAPTERVTNHPGNESTWGGDWFFTPAPFVYGLGDEDRWAMFGLGCRASEATFFNFDYRGGPIWGLGLTYQGYTKIDGRWETPHLLILPASDEYQGVQAYCRWLLQQGYCPSGTGEQQEWWREPIWCGWGEQVAREGPQPARELSTQANYLAWLERIESAGLQPGTVCIDDRWMARMGSPAPHPERWPNLADFIASRQRRGQRVLLWHNVWEIESPPASSAAAAAGAEPTVELISHQGQPAIGLFGSPMLDPTSPTAEPYLRRLVTGLLAPPPAGLGADGLKLDITQSTPTGAGYELRGESWGNALLHGLLAMIYRLAKEVAPEALIECHAANPLFRDTADVLRLNDLHTDLTSVVEMMRHRSRIARAAGFDLIDTDGWPIPSLEALLEYVEAQPELGIPALYYATRLDQSKESLDPGSLRRIAAVWKRYRG